MKQETSVVEVIPSLQLPADPSWERARGFVGQIQTGIEGVVRLGLELKALHNQWHNNGRGGDRKSDAAQIKRPLADDRSQDIHPAALAQGWQAKVREEIGISHQAAMRIMDKAMYVKMIASVSSGRSVLYLDSRRREKTLEPTAEHQALAQEAMQEIVVGSATPSRAWAGIVGEGGRRKGRVAERAAVDHAENLKDGLRKLKNSLRHWRKLEPGERAEIECLWSEVAGMLPDTWTV